MRLRTSATPFSRNCTGSRRLCATDRAVTSTCYRCSTCSWSCCSCLRRSRRASTKQSGPSLSASRRNSTSRARQHQAEAATRLRVAERGAADAKAESERLAAQLDASAQQQAEVIARLEVAEREAAGCEEGGRQNSGGGRLRREAVHSLEQRRSGERRRSGGRRGPAPHGGAGQATQSLYRVRD